MDIPKRAVSKVKTTPIAVTLEIDGRRQKVQLKINEKLIGKLQRLAEFRDEDAGESLQVVLKAALRQIPNRFIRWDAAPAELKVAGVGIEDSVPFIRLENGRIFYSHLSNPKAVFLYHIMRDRIDSIFSAETYGLAIDAGKRYLNGANYDYMPGSGGVIVEAGAYVGYKAIRFAEVVGPTGKVVAIEIMPSNYELLCRNIEANGLTDVVIPVCCALSNETGEITVKSRGFQKNTIVDIDDRDYEGRSVIPQDTLDNILDRLDIETVDFMNMQINGAEVKAMEGLQRRLESVKILRIASYYSQDGKPLADVVCKMLEGRGCTILNRTGKGGSIHAVSKPYVEEFSGRS